MDRPLRPHTNVPGSIAGLYVDELILRMRDGPSGPLCPIFHNNIEY